MIKVTKTGHNLDPEKIEFTYSKLIRLLPFLRARRNKEPSELADILVTGAKPSGKRIEYYKTAKKTIMSEDEFREYCIKKYPEYFI